MKVHIQSLEQTRECAARIAAACKPGDVIGLIGDLGAGKTEFVRGFVHFFDENAGVRSPSFSLVNSYETVRFPIHHFDFYRLGSPDELIEIGFDEYMEGEGVCLIEWADMFSDVLPENTFYIHFTSIGQYQRTLEIDDRLAEDVRLQDF
ncbi:MAG: tRNA (adenosine(37)-N6)-threonylcarbamoyltransferase complex ATPase subunit type 1 TsaE [Fibrobacterota bacterium]